MTEGIEKEARERFEKWVIGQTELLYGNSFPIRTQDGYVYGPTHIAWMGWQAAFAQSCVERPARFDCPNCRHPLVSDQGMPVCLMCRHRMCYQVMEFISDDEAKKIEAESAVERESKEPPRANAHDPNVNTGPTYDQLKRALIQMQEANKELVAEMDRLKAESPVERESIDIIETMSHEEAIRRWPESKRLIERARVERESKEPPKIEIAKNSVLQDLKRLCKIVANAHEVYVSDVQHLHWKSGTFLRESEKSEPPVDRAVGERTEDAKELADLLCPPHANLDKNNHLEPFDNCIACIRVERDELRALLLRISTDIGQTIIEDPIKSADGWTLLSKPVLADIAAVFEYRGPSAPTGEKNGI